MNTGDALLRTILEHPEEDTPRLAYADYLEENGQADRARFIRWQIGITPEEPAPACQWKKWFKMPWQMHYHRRYGRGRTIGRKTFRRSGSRVPTLWTHAFRGFVEDTELHVYDVAKVKVIRFIGSQPIHSVHFDGISLISSGSVGDKPAETIYVFSDTIRAGLAWIPNFLCRKSLWPDDARYVEGHPAGQGRPVCICPWDEHNGRSRLTQAYIRFCRLWVEENPA